MAMGYDAADSRNARRQTRPRRGGLVGSGLDGSIDIAVTITGAIGAVCNLPLRLIIAACVRLRIHPNLLTFTGVLISVAAGWQLALGHFRTAGFIMVCANIFDFIDGKVATEMGAVSKFGGFWDSVIDRFSDLALSVGLICLYASLGRTDYVLITSIAMVFATMTSYARARAESLIPRCKVGFMERPERIVLFMIGAFTNRMAAVMWVIGVLSIVTVLNRIQYTYLELTGRPQPRRGGLTGLFVRAFYWTDERTTVPYDLWVLAILAFVWITPPTWLGDPMAPTGQGVLQWLMSR
jgi:CDP-diacylglycerol--glycerol-3-phosphate 3-phosphatidyltransferase